MQVTSHSRLRWCSVLAATMLAASVLPVADAWSAETLQGDAAALHQRATSLEGRLQQSSVFGESMLLESTESDELARGDVYALVPHGLHALRSELAAPSQWCDVLILHLNVKQCRAAAGRLTLRIGSKLEWRLERGLPLELSFLVVADTHDYLQLRMTAPQGPLGTRDYELMLEALPRGAGSTFVHFRYQVGYGALARVAMKAYLLTAGHDKVGFSRNEGDGEYVKGERGAVERNAVRYHLAITAYLGSLAVPPPQRNEQRLTAWFDATERYHLQLHELDREDYLAMKRRQLAAADAVAVPR